MKKDKSNDKVGADNNQGCIDPNTTPFDTVEEAWFWFVLAQQAKVDGARYVAGMSSLSRPCEPNDILKVLNGLYRNRMLLWDHILVLRHYGRRQMAPDPRRVKEMRADKLWGEALNRLEPILIRKGIVAPKKTFDLGGRDLKANESWSEEAVIHSNDADL